MASQVASPPSRHYAPRWVHLACESETLLALVGAPEIVCVLRPWLLAHIITCAYYMADWLTVCRLGARKTAWVLRGSQAIWCDAAEELLRRRLPRCAVCCFIQCVHNCNAHFQGCDTPPCVTVVFLVHTKGGGALTIATVNVYARVQGQHRADGVGAPPRGPVPLVRHLNPVFLLPPSRTKLAMLGIFWT